MIISRKAYDEMLDEKNKIIADLLNALELAKGTVEWVAGATDSDLEDHERLAIVNKAIRKAGGCQMKREYTIHDILIAECTLEPLVCLHCGSLEVTFHQYLSDAYCGDCGRWQLEED